MTVCSCFFSPRRTAGRPKPNNFFYKPYVARKIKLNAHAINVSPTSLSSKINQFCMLATSRSLASIAIATSWSQTWLDFFFSGHTTNRTSSIIFISDPIGYLSLISYKKKNIKHVPGYYYIIILVFNFFVEQDSREYCRFERYGYETETKKLCQPF